MPVTSLLAQLMAHVQQLVFPQEECWSEESFIQVGQMPGVFCLIAGRQEESHPLGTMPVLQEGAVPDVSLQGMIIGYGAADEAEILTFAVHPRFQRQGIGTLLLAALEEKVKAQGVHKIFLEVSEQNVTAKNLYASQGYRQVGRRKAYYATGADALVMSKMWS